MSKKVKIKLRVNLPVNDKHGMTKGRVLDAERNPDHQRYKPLWWVTGDTGEKVGVLKNEAEIVR